MPKSNVKRAEKNLVKAIQDDIIQKLESLDLSPSKTTLIVDAIRKLKTSSKRSPPLTPIEKQCLKTCKSGKKCTVAICYEKSCWAHLNKEKRDEYRKIKDEKNK